MKAMMKTLTPVSALHRPQRPRRVRGFSLIELMVAITLGILVSIGLVTLFGATSKTNRVQDAMAQMQENGRYAIGRLNADLRLASRQLMNTGGQLAGAPGANGAVTTAIAPQVYVAAIPFYDGPVNPPAGWDPTAALAWWPLSPSYFLQGYECGTGTCSPLPVPVISATGSTVVAQRVNVADVLTMRYLRNDGWSFYKGEVTTTCNGPILVDITLTPVVTGSNPSPPSNFATNNLAMLTTTSFAAIFQVNVAGTVLTPINVLHGGFVPCFDTEAAAEVNLFNFSRDFVSVTYWLRLADDTNNPGRLLPTLVRSQYDNLGTAVQPQELVQGVEQMDFLYGMQTANGSVSYFTADGVAAQSTAANCTLPPGQYLPPNLPAGTFEPGCLWRSVKSVEAHILVDNVTNMFDLSPPETYYHYNDNSGSGSIAPPATLPSGLPAGSMMRREFVSLVSVRNFNP